MKVAELTGFLEGIAPGAYQESYDNAGLITGDPGMDVTGVLLSLDCTEAIVDEALASGCNVIVSHHPIIFKGLKKLNGKNYVERVVIKAIRSHVALFAIHTNLDSIHTGVNKRICDRLGLSGTRVLQPKQGLLRKLVTYCPHAQADHVRQALFRAGAGQIGDYSECSFNQDGFGTFKGAEQTNPFAGHAGQPHREPETRIETVYNAQDERKILLALLESHPYEEVAYDLFRLENAHPQVGSGMIGWLEPAVEPGEFLRLLQEKMETEVIRHTALLNRPIRKIAVCGGSGSFLLQEAIAAGADVFVTADFKYHEFFDADGKIMIADIGHYESEQFTSDLLGELLKGRFRELRVLKTTQRTNPVLYFRA
ncbi:Nif3-like dinuclear metal center hexameric protein [Pedobacter yulinensis]|uniref:GTP cyclohydrolase 1 type 2 homolog n=1 Tax=Pedobacter yulinensis TaxID=2126353 RepID=A0A2T3HRF9_9SPHI|nr:Nif3-like dinuclear metal center hexameric protein [Pedobacter yulinensis]PST85044.1 Nif3-like dinuclear metal center hexameric protein [Pedobacter yulinensis]